MSISRRRFIRGTAATVAGFILPSFVDRVFRHVDLTGEPLLGGGRATDLIFHAQPTDEGEFVLIDTSTEFALYPPPTTWRQYFTFAGMSTAEMIEEGGIDVQDLDRQANPGLVGLQWEVAKSPGAMAFNKLSKYETSLGPELVGDGDKLGYLEFIQGPSPCSSDSWVEVSGPVGLSCLQHRLSVLEAGIRIEVAPEGLY